MSDLAVSSSLLIATLDLNLVRSITAAMRSADAMSAQAQGSRTAPVNGSSNGASTRTIQRTVYLRNSEKPAATYEPRPVHHWHTREMQPYACERPVLPSESKPAIQPPWRVLPWPIAGKSFCHHHGQTIKAQSNRADVTGVGRTLDLFI